MDYRECDFEMNEEEFFDLVDESGSYEPKMTARQRIEMAREERSLRSLLADFDDWEEEYDGENYPDFERFGDYYVDRAS